MTLEFGSLVVTALCTLTMVTAGCKSRIYNVSGTRASDTGQGEVPMAADTEGPSAASDRTRVSFDPPGSRLDAPPTDYAADTPDLDSSGTPVPPPGTDGQPLKSMALLADPVRYFNEVVTPRSQAGGGALLPARLATKTVLEAMQRTRRYFYRNIPDVTNRRPPSVRGMRPTLADLKAKGLTALSMEADIFPAAPNDPEIKERCTDFGVPHYSDIMLHYYCQIPSIWRGCHRVLHLAVAKADVADVHPERKKKARRWVIETCSTTTDFAFDAKVGEMFLKAPKDMPKVGILFDQARVTKEYFQAFYETQRFPGEGGRWVNVFDYVMNSQTWAFDLRDQQAVINSYYGEMKPASEGPWNPGDADQCRKWRLPRKEDDAAANYCDWRAPKKEPLHSIGR